MAVKRLLPLVLSAACFLFIILCGGWIALTPRPTLLTLKTVIDVESCTRGEIWTDPWSNPQSRPSQQYNISYPLTKQPISFSQNLIAPVAFFRYDLCTLSNQTLTLHSLTLTYQDRSLTIPLADVQKWECNNCQAKLNQAGQLVVKTTTPHPYLIGRDFDTYLRDLNVTYHRAYPTVRKTVGVAALVMGISIVGGLLFLMSVPLFLTLGSTVVVALVASYWIYTHYWSLTPFFPLPPLSVSSGIGYAQHQGFPTVADIILFMAPFVVAGGWLLMIRICMYGYEKIRRHH